ncbi:hypothetical protein BaRGS_00001823 [Batillaria attramentaria]|uniref:Uncharacterized protein n=1 Tax=Batillaria attramentaria TaxID=370345 RepID=A0ABD0M5Q5_9CAEN
MAEDTMFQNAELVQEARTTRSLRDELDILKEKASKVDMYEKEILKYKERLNELEFYKARTEELREETQILEETRTMLEEQLATSRKRVETVVELEAELMKYRQQIENLYAERDLDRERIELLTEENARLEFEKKSSMNESASLEQELEDARAKVGNMRGSLSDQLTETSNAKILRLELENQRLSAKLREMQDGALIHSAEVNLQLEKENQRLSKRIEKLQETAQDASEKLFAAEEEQHKVEGERRELQQALDMVKENYERQVRELEQENAQLSHTIEVLRERNEKTNDAKMKDLERENKRMTETINAKNTQMSKMEFENRQLQRSYSKLKENVDRISELENENASVEKENSELHQKVATLQHTCDKLERLEQEFSDMEVENRKLQKTVDTLQAAMKKKEQLEQDHINLTVEKQKLERTLENLKGSSTKVAELESEKDLLNKEIQQVRKLLESQKAQKAKQEQLEFDVIDLNNENQRLQKTLEVTTKRLQQLEKDNSDIEAENEQLQKQIESFKMSSRKLEDREKESQELETELDKVQKDKAALEKENRKLRQSLDVKESSLDELSSKFRTLEADHKTLRRSLEQMQATATRLKELEKENKDMFQEMNADRRTLATLREKCVVQELVKEKITSQELHNELEKLHQELEHVGINTKKLALAEQSQDENRLKALESLMQETLKKNSEIKDEKIQALETRLEESKSRNLKLQDELRQARCESEAVKQRYEEEVAGHKSLEMSSRRPDRHRVEVHHVQSSPPNATKEILQLKDHLVELERTNATLLADSSNLQANVSSLSDQCRKLEKQVSGLQVENTTLQSKCVSLASEKADLQMQHSNLESEHDVLIQRLEDVSGKREALAHDHEALQDLHKQLSLEYEALISEHGSLKAIHKSLKNELKDVQEQLDAFLQGKDDVNKIRDMLEKERQQLKMEQRSLGNLQMDYNRLRDDQDRLRTAYDKLSRDYSDSLASHKALKSELNALQLKNTEQSGELTEAKEQLSGAVMEVQKAENRLDTMYQVNERLENENQTLLLQIQQLLNQNHDLLTQALNSKDHFAEEEKAYLEKLSELRRQKERLEEKIMEHYKNRLNSPKKNKGIGAMIARKARNIISRAPRRSKSRPDLTVLNDNSSQGSGSHGDSMEQVNNDSGSKRTAWLGRRSHTPVASADSPKLARQNKSLAKSYSALPLMDSPKSRADSVSRIRGAKSTEDLSKDVVGDDEMEGGFRTLSPTPLPVLRGRGGRASPGSEMLTLEQFLKEANREAETNTPLETRRSLGRRRSQEDTESRSSENSDNSHNRALQRLQAASDPNLSRLSRISSGSGNIQDISTSSPPGPISRVDMLTSTPKAETMGSGSRGRGVEERGRWPDGSDRWYDDQPKLDSRRSTGPEVSSHMASPQYSSQGGMRVNAPEPVRSPPPLPTSARPMSSRELPPTPMEREQRRESLPPTERLDRLTGRPSDPERRKSGVVEQSSAGREARHSLPRSRSVGPQGYNPQDSVSSPGGRGAGGRQSVQGVNDRDHEREADRDHSYRDSDRYSSAGRSLPPQSAPGSQQPSSRHSVQLQAPRPYQRPASVLGHPSPHQAAVPRSGSSRADYNNSNASTNSHRQNSNPGEQVVRSPRRAQPMVNDSNGPVPRRDTNEYGQHPVERPKSVPPQFFNRSDSGPPYEGQSGSSAPVPAPRHSRDPRDREFPAHERQASQPSIALAGPLVTSPTGSRPTSHGSGPLPNRYSGPGGPPQSQSYGPGSAPGGVPNHASGSGRPPPHYQPGPGGYQGGPRQSDSPNGPPSQPHSRSMTPGPRYGSDPHNRDGPPSEANSVYARPHSSVARPYPGNQPSPQSAQQRLSSGGGNQPGPQHPYRGGMPHPQGVSRVGDMNSVHHSPMEQHPHSNTPMARIPPQTKQTGSSAGRTDPPPAQRTAVGDEQPGDRPKKNSVWYEYGCV